MTRPSSAGRGLVLLLLGARLGASPGCKPPPAPEELPPRFVFRIEFKDPCDQPIPGVQFELLADPTVARPARPPGKAPHEWRGHVRGQADEFGEVRIDLGTDWGSSADVHAVFAGKIDEVRAAPDCFVELANRSILEVVLDTYTCGESRHRAAKANQPFVQLYTRGGMDNFKRKRRARVECRDVLPPLAADPATTPPAPPPRGAAP